MSNPATSVKSTVDQIMSWVQWLVSIALVLVFFVTIAQHLGFRIPMIRGMGALELLYFAAAWAFLTGRIKLG